MRMFATKAVEVVLCVWLLGGCPGCSADHGPGDGGPDGGVSCGTASVEALMACASRDDYLADLEFVAQPRPPGSVHHQAVADLCAQRFEQLGFTVERHDYGSGANVIGTLTGGDRAAEQVLVSAHYDHIANCPGADDNGSGVAGLLQVARVLSQADFARSLVVACWDEEERGLIGSAAYSQRAIDRGQIITAHFVYEMIGVFKREPNSQTMPDGLELLFPDQAAELEANQFRGDFAALIFDTSHSQPAVDDLVELGARIGLKTVALGLSDALKNSNLVSDLRRSDHAPFWMDDLPGIMITDTSEFRYPQYHCRDGDDVIENLDHDFTLQVVQATLGAAARALELR